MYDHLSMFHLEDTKNEKEDVKPGSGQPVDTQNFIRQDILYVQPLCHR